MARIRPLPGDGPGPRPLREGVDRVLRGLGAPETRGVSQVFERWAEVVGESMAARTRPLRLQGGTLVLGVDEPAVATHVRFLEPQLLERLGELLGEGRVRSIELRVGPKR
ncbi:MAG: DUF721 domain-containing protein [Acidimicrobiia bacterium]